MQKLTIMTDEDYTILDSEITNLKSDLTELKNKQVTEEDIDNLGFWKETDGKTYVDSEITDLKAQGVQQTPLFANSIEEMTDTSKVYVMEDPDSGKLYVYGHKKATTTTEGSKIPNFTNLLNAEVLMSKRVTDIHTVQRNGKH